MRIGDKTLPWSGATHYRWWRRWRRAKAKAAVNKGSWTGQSRRARQSCHYAPQGVLHELQKIYVDYGRQH